MQDNVIARSAWNWQEPAVHGRVCAALIRSLLAVMLILPVPLSAHPIETLLADFDAPGFEWDQVQSMELTGTPVYVRPFVSIKKAPAAAHELAAHSRLFQRVLTVRDKVVLSGLHTQWHWMAEINQTSTGSTGYVSAMHVDPEQQPKDAGQLEDDLSWLPANAQRRFSQRLIVDKKKLTHHIYSTGQSAGEVTSYVRKQLRDSGWKIEPDYAALPGAMVWQRKRLRLTIIPIASPQGSSLFVQYLE